MLTFLALNYTCKFLQKKKKKRNRLKMEKNIIFLVTTLLANTKTFDDLYSLVTIGQKLHNQ